jgi:hypothetical protein
LQAEFVLGIGGVAGIEADGGACHRHGVAPGVDHLDAIGEPGPLHGGEVEIGELAHLGHLAAVDALLRRRRERLFALLGRAII